MVINNQNQFLITGAGFLPYQGGNYERTHGVLLFDINKNGDTIKEITGRSMKVIKEYISCIKI